MHYIRFLKPPRLLGGRRGNAPSVLKAKVTVTTDLGESFLWANVDLVVELTDGTGKRVLERGKGYTWKGSEGMRSLQVELLIPAFRCKESGGMLRMLVRPKEDFLAVENFERMLGDSNEHEDTGKMGCVMAVRSMAIEIPSNQSLPISTTTSMAERTFRFGKSEIHIWEETGESIARHIWYACTTQNTHRYVRLLVHLVNTETGTPDYYYQPTLHQYPTHHPKKPHHNSHLCNEPYFKKT